MLTKSPDVLHVADVPVGSLFYYPELGSDTLCIAACYDGQQGPATVVITLAPQFNDVDHLGLVDIDNLSGLAVLVEGFRAEVDLRTSTVYDRADVRVGNAGIYVSVVAGHPLMRKWLRLDDGRLCSSCPSISVGFKRWRIVSEDDPEDELWSSDKLDQHGGVEA